MRVRVRERERDSPEADNGGSKKSCEDNLVNERKFQGLVNVEINGDADEE